jgi:hypothetical protein
MLRAGRGAGRSGVDGTGAGLGHDGATPSRGGRGPRRARGAVHLGGELQPARKVLGEGHDVAIGIQEQEAELERNIEGLADGALERVGGRAGIPADPDVSIPEGDLDGLLRRFHDSSSGCGGERGASTPHGGPPERAIDASPRGSTEDRSTARLVRGHHIRSLPDFFRPAGKIRRQRLSGRVRVVVVLTQDNRRDVKAARGPLFGERRHAVRLCSPVRAAAAGVGYPLGAAPGIRGCCRHILSGPAGCLER